MDLMKFLKGAIISSVLVFLFLLLFDWVLGYAIDYKDNAVQAIVLGFVVFPVSDWLIKKLKLN